ncbi:hypothetical protein JCGZ_23149 [Jatropha curcas]|uniref:Uncharacterized protein n=1 Tax=Jatropha curcas TaxID=180498 RepID=A0A067JHB0_JATCU|nr:hypothetical protein JCGZ_23149 [Jatropha curcas]
MALVNRNCAHLGPTPIQRSDSLLGYTEHNSLIMEKRQLFLRSYQFSRKQSLTEKMGFQDIVAGMHSRYGYKKLNSCDEKFVRPRRCSWIKKMNGGLKGIRLYRSKKLTFKALSVMVLPRRIARIYGDIISRIKMDDLYPNIIFSTQLGLPVLSHPSVKCRRSTIYLQRNLTFVY